MQYQSELKPRAIKDLGKIPKTDARRIVEKIRILEDNLTGDVKQSSPPAEPVAWRGPQDGGKTCSSSSDVLVLVNEKGCHVRSWKTQYLPMGHRIFSLIGPCHRNDRARARARFTDTDTFPLSDRQSLLGSHQLSWWFNKINYITFCMKGMISKEVILSPKNR